MIPAPENVTVNFLPCRYHYVNMSRDFVRQHDRDPQESVTPSSPPCRCVQHRHPERPTGVEGSPSNRKSGIRNSNNRPIFNRFHFSNRKYSAIFQGHRATNLRPPDSRPPYIGRLIETSRLKIRITLTISTTSNFLIETKLGFSFCPPPLASPCPRLRVSVPPWPIFAIMAGSD